MKCVPLKHDDIDYINIIKTCEIDKSIKDYKTLIKSAKKTKKQFKKDYKNGKYNYLKRPGFKIKGYQNLNENIWTATINVDYIQNTKAIKKLTGSTKYKTLQKYVQACADSCKAVEENEAAPKKKTCAGFTVNFDKTTS